MDLRVELDEKPFPLEAELSEPGPVESVDPGAALKSKRQMLSNDTRVIQMHTHAFPSNSVTSLPKSTALYSEANYV